MFGEDCRKQFCSVASRVGAAVVEVGDLSEAVAYIGEHGDDAYMVPDSVTLERLGVKQALRDAGKNVVDREFRSVAKLTPCAVTSANFAISDSGTLALDSTDENIRLATMLAEKHFVIFDPAKVLPDAVAAAAPMREFHRRDPRNYVAFITGPSRTADIERVLTIGVHGPCELHILLMNGISSDPLES